MSDEHTPKPPAAETPSVQGLDAGVKIAARATEIATLIGEQLRQHFPNHHDADTRLPVSEREDAAFVLAKREAELENAKEIAASLSLEGGDNIARKKAEDAYSAARERYEKQAEYIARRTGASQPDAFRNMRDRTSRMLQRCTRAVRNNPVPVLGATGAGVYSLGGLIATPVLTSAEAALATAVGNNAYLLWLANGGIVLGAGAVGYGLGKFVGRALGSERIGKYVGMLGGSIGAAATLGLTASSVGATVGVPLGVYGSWKLGKALYRRIWPAQRFDAKAMQKESERRTEGPKIIRAIDRLGVTYQGVGGDPQSPIVTRLQNLRQWADALAQAHPAHSLAEVQAEWTTLKTEAEQAITDAQKKTNDRRPEVRSAEDTRKVTTFQTSCAQMHIRWAALPLLPAIPPAIQQPVEMPPDVLAALTDADTCINDYINVTPSHYSIQEVQTAFTKAEEKFSAAWIKALERTDAEIPELQAIGTTILTTINDSFDSFSPDNQNHPSAQQLYALARVANTAAVTTNDRLQHARTPVEAREQYKKLNDQQDTVQEKIEEALAKVSSADTNARQAILTAEQIDPPDIQAMNALFRQFPIMQRFMDRQINEADAAQRRNAPAHEFDQIWARNRSDIDRTRIEIDQNLQTLTTSSWPRADIQRLSTDFSGAFTLPNAPDFDRTRLKAVLESSEAKLKSSAQEAMSPLVTYLQALRHVAGEGVTTIDRLITQCGSSGLPLPVATRQVLSPFLDQTLPPP